MSDELKKTEPKKNEPQKNQPQKNQPQKNQPRPLPGDRNFKAGIAVGIGSAAIVAALLYARSGPKKKK